MKPTIDAMWNGSVSLAANCGAGDPEMENLVKLMERHKDMLNKELEEQHRIVFEKYVDCTEEYVYLICKHAFSDGFSLASRLLSEAFSGS